MGNFEAVATGNPREAESFNPLPAMEELSREATLNPLQAKVILESLAPEQDAGRSNKHDDEEGCKGDASQDSQDPDQVPEAGETQDVKAQEQFMRVEVQIPAEYKQRMMPNQQRSHIIVVADCSGSMSGNPWKQVKGALVDIVSASLQGNVVVDIVVYNDEAQLIKFTPEDYESKLSSLVAYGATSFVAAFSQVDEVIRQRAAEKLTSTAIMFMTDGEDTVSTRDVLNNRLHKWKAALQALNREITIHTVGFTSEHDFKFLQELSGAGTRAGLFRYSEPQDGPEKLKKKVEELFDYAMYSSKPAVDVWVEMDGENKIIGPGKLLQSHSVRAEITSSEQEQTTHTENLTVQAEMWVFVRDADVLPVPIITLSKTVSVDGAAHTVQLPCVCSSVEKKVLDDAASKAMWGLNILSRNTDVLATKIAITIEAKKDVSSLQIRMTRLQNRLSNMRLFGPGIKRDLRESIMATMKEIQAKMDTMHSMLARYSRGETASVSILARAHDLRYEAQFKKSRRQRLMNKRAVQNVRRAKADQAKLQNLAADEAEIAQLSEEAVGFFFCALSQDSVVDILRDVENKENAIGFGLAVARPEYAVDDPTSVRLCLISGTLVSRSSMLDALEFKINLAGHLEAHNGFNFFSSSLGYATVGAGREPINAWLPLYVTQSHWERVKVILKPSLGYLCTLDPLGFDWRQLDVLFMVLGAMIGQLSDTSVGLHQLQLLFAFQRTCTACIEDFNLTERIMTTVRDFVRTPKGRFKNAIPNLYTLIGYIAALPVSQSRQLLGYDEEGRDPKQLPVKFWNAMLAETLRRAGSCFKNYSDKELNTLVDLLLHGRNNSLMMPSHVVGKAQAVDSCCTSNTSNKAATAGDAAAASAATSTPPTAATTAPSATAAQKEVSASSVGEGVEGEPTAQMGQADSLHQPQTSTAAAHFAVMCSKMALQENADLLISGVEPSGEPTGSSGKKPAQAEVVMPMVEFKHSVKMDLAMEVWAQAELGIIKNKNQSDKVSAARKKVKEWLKEGRQLAGLPDPDDEDDKEEEEEEPFDCDAIDSSILEITSKLLTRLSRASFPLLSAFPGAMAFLHAWLSVNQSVTEMKDGLPPPEWIDKMKDGLPPPEWIDKMKAAVKQMYAAMDGYVSHCDQQVSDSGLDSREVLVIEGEADTGRSRGNRGGGRGRGKRGVIETTGDEEDESDGEDYAHLEEDDPMKILKRRQQEHRGLVTLPMILDILDPCQNKVNVTRAMLCQAVLHCTNVRSKEAVSGDRFLDLKEEDGVASTLCSLHKSLVQMCKFSSYQILWQRANVHLVQAQSIWAFLGYLMNTYKERDEGFGQFMTMVTALEKGSTVPCLEDKVKVMLSGRWEQHNVLARGNSRLPGKVLSKNLEKVLGEEGWVKVELELCGNLHIHVYRESDIPNRHGHCNSNPYIPPALRFKLKMPRL